LSARLAAESTALHGGAHDRLPDAFVAGAAALQHVRNDALLPAELLPADWPGADLRAQYRTYQRAFAEAAGAWFRALDGVGAASSVRP
jgi:phenylacetic acid degradation operon negative regulatory protein